MDRNRNEAARADGGRPGRLFSSALIGGLAAALCLFQPALARSQDPVVLENENLLVAFSAQDGVFTRIRNKKTGQELITIASAAAATRPWAMMLAPFELVSDFTKFRIVPPAADRAGQADLEWETPYQITVHATARLKPGADELELRCSAENHGGRTILALRYPAVGGIGTLSADGKTDRLLHSTMMGALFFDPFHLFRGGSRILPERGVAPSRYPNGFHGSALQLMAYYTEGKGGFSITTRDTQGNDKDFSFYKMPDDKSLACEIAHIQADARPGKSLTVDYPAYITALDRGAWYAAAERYRAWALQQKWCERGPLAERVARNDASRWLLERTGAVGAWWPFRRDIRDEIVRTRRFWGAPLMHLELWWSHDPSRVEAQREGDHFGPFYFPFLALRNREVFARHAGDAIEPPATPISPDWVAMCPVQPGPRKVAVESAEDLVGTGPLRHHQIWIDENRTGCAADCLYFDVGPCAGVPTHCYAKNHGHPPGAGGAVTRAYVSLIQ